MWYSQVTSPFHDGHEEEPEFEGLRITAHSERHGHKVMTKNVRHVDLHRVLTLVVHRERHSENWRQDIRRPERVRSTLLKPRRGKEQVSNEGVWGGGQNASCEHHQRRAYD